MQPVLDLIARIGPSDANVLITGEHGTGKEVVARTLHAMSNRAQKPMVTVNAGLSKFSGVVQADTVISNSVISSSYTPGAGNIW